MKKDILNKLKEYMLSNNIGFVEIRASTNYNKTNIKVEFYEEDEDEIKDYGYQC